jgi:hypothetical protein
MHIFSNLNIKVTKNLSIMTPLFLGKWTFFPGIRSHDAFLCQLNDHFSAMRIRFFPVIMYFTPAETHAMDNLVPERRFEKASDPDDRYWTLIGEQMEKGGCMD